MFATKRNFAVCMLFALPAWLASPRSARADEAQVTVGRIDDDDGRYAEPPPDREPRASVSDTPPYYVRSEELYRAPVRMTLGPIGATTGRGLGIGLGAAVDIGTGTVGFRLAGAWARAEASAASGTPLGDGLAQYSGELTLDLHKRGPWHPIIAVGLGLAHVSRATGSADAGIGTGRVAIEYALAVEDADVRLGAGVLGALTGPADRELADLRGYAILSTTLSIGF
jgi:hypothetical protein